MIFMGSEEILSILEIDVGGECEEKLPRCATRTEQIHSRAGPGREGCKGVAGETRDGGVTAENCCTDLELIVCDELKPEHRCSMDRDDSTAPSVHVADVSNSGVGIHVLVEGRREARCRNERAAKANLETQVRRHNSVLFVKMLFQRSVSCRAEVAARLVAKLELGEGVGLAHVKTPLERDLWVRLAHVPFEFVDDDVAKLTRGAQEGVFFDLMEQKIVVVNGYARLERAFRTPPRGVVETHFL